jgi:NTE family protein
MVVTQLSSNLRMAFPALGALTAENLDALVKNSERRAVRRGEILMRQGEPSDALHFVVSGRFMAHNERTVGPFTEIGQGQPIGEIGFFANVPRTLTVIALRDSEILTITRDQFRQLGDASPDIREAVIISLANRLAETSLSVKETAIPRTLALVPAGGSRTSLGFLEALRKVFGARSRVLFLTEEEVANRFPGKPLDDRTISNWLNSLEAEAEFIFYVADQELTDWTKKCIRQGDVLISVATARAETDLNASERLAFSVHPSSRRRLVVLHQSRSHVALGTNSWLRGRDVIMHHHVSLQDDVDVWRLYRFLSGKALGFVAGGGGALGSAHVGVYKAFLEAGADFDILGGTSVGAAMTGALALGLDAESVDAGTHTVFVKSRSFKRFTLPYFGILNHKVFDRELKSLYGEAEIEDLWRPFFAISTNLSTNKIMVHRRGTLWRAVRASSSIPAVLPPFFTDEGEMLVDGAVMDNLPLAPMRAIKAGPNVIVTLSLDVPRKHAISYDRIPGAGGLAWAILNPLSRRRLPEVPSIFQVVTRSMAANRQTLSLGDSDILIQPEFPKGVAWMSWDRHTEILMCAYHGAASSICKGITEKDPRLTAVIGAGR